jgi:hypothetical protein
LDTYAQGISGNSIVGYYVDSPGIANAKGFLYNGKKWTTLDFPGAAYGTFAQGIDGSNIVGGYYDSSNYGHGFLYNGTSWTTLNYPGAELTWAYGISGSNIVGWYSDGDASSVHGFIYTIPEPATLLLFGLGAAIIRKFKN